MILCPTTRGELLVLLLHESFLSLFSFFFFLFFSLSSVGQVGGGHFYFQLDPVVERRSHVMGVHERIFQAHLEQPRALAPHQRIDHALAQALRGAVDRLMDDPEIHDNDRVFARFHAPCQDSGFAQGLPVRRWRQEPQMVTAFLDRLA